MIDLGLAKLALIGAVALIVIGPEKLPKVARMAGSLLGRAQRYLNEVKAEVSRDMELDELRKMQQEVEQVAGELKSGVTTEITDVKKSVNSIWSGSKASSFAPGLLSTSSPLQQSHRKAREFRRKKTARNAGLPGWYKRQKRQKRQQGGKTNILSAAARVAKYRSKATSIASFY